VWRPIQASVSSYGTNGVYLKFDPGATNGIGHDHSGNGNNFTPTGFTTSGTGTDVMSDTPTTNYATWNPLDNTGVTLANGNLDFSGGSSNDCGGTFAVASGKWYWEIECRTDIGPGGQPLAHGIHNASVTSDFRLQAVWFYTDASSNSQVRRYANNSNVAQVSMPASIRDIDIGDILQVAYDADSGEVWFGVDNTWMDGSGGTTGNPGSGSNPVFTLPDASIPMTPWRSHAGLNWDGYTNFGQRDFAYTPPTGFNALNTANLPAPTVKDGSDYFQTVTYSGTGATRDITVADNTDNAWQPDLVWIKNRDITDHHAWFDSVRGVLNYISSNRTNVEAALANSLTSFNSDGFTLDSANLTNYLNQAYVSWNWLAANGTEVLDAGSINSTVSANPTAGFSIVNWTVGSTDNQTVAHGLGVPPDLIITKNRDTGYGWATYHSPLGATKYLTLDTSNTPVTNSIAWNNTEPTSTVFTVGDASWWGSSTDSMIAYCFAEVENYSKFGSYTGNGSLDGPFVYCGFRPAWVIIKRTDGTGEWFMVDTSRNPYNPSDQDLFADSDTKETSSSGKDLLSNGFKIRESGASMNASGGSFIFMAFSEHPFGGSGVSPATAR